VGLISFCIVAELSPQFLILFLMMPNILLKVWLSLIMEPKVAETFQSLRCLS